MKNKNSNVNDVIFLVIFLFHLVSRQWPYGDMFQTVLDVLLGITAILIVVKYFVVKNKARRREDNDRKCY